MREILFKAKRIDNGEWAKGSLFAEGKITKIIRCTCNTIGIEGVDVNPETICQYTGLNDKNGKLIWENDIVEVKNDKHHFISQIEWDNFCKGFMFQDTKTTACGMDAISDSGCYRFGCEVIGNIFDNPELITEESHKK